MNRTCSACGESKPADNFPAGKGNYRKRCSLCNDKAYQEAPARKRGDFRDRWGLMSPEAKQKCLAERRARYAAIKVLVMAHYGNACECCGETEPLFLTIDHVHNFGTQRRRRDNGHGIVYRWLVRNNFPPGFRILCSNCNHGRYRNGGICPHQDGSQARAQARSRECGEVPDTLTGKDMVDATLKNVDASLSLQPWGLQ